VEGAATGGVKRDGKGEAGTQLGQQLTEFVLTNHVVGPAVAELLTNAMVWPDSSGATRAATALQRMVPKIKHLPQYHEVVGAMLRVVLWGLGRLAANLPVSCASSPVRRGPALLRAGTSLSLPLSLSLSLSLFSPSLFLLLSPTLSTLPSSSPIRDCG
jgi:hypothetical protein